MPTNCKNCYKPEQNLTWVGQKHQELHQDNGLKELCLSSVNGESSAQLWGSLALSTQQMSLGSGTWECPTDPHSCLCPSTRNSSLGGDIYHSRDRNRRKLIHGLLMGCCVDCSVSFLQTFNASKRFTFNNFSKVGSN